jgi:hypothetical protein
MAASRPAGSLRQEVRVIGVSNENVPWFLLFLEMAFQAQGRVPFV